MNLEIYVTTLPIDDDDTRCILLRTNAVWASRALLSSSHGRQKMHFQATVTSYKTADVYGHVTLHDTNYVICHASSVMPSGRRCMIVVLT